MHLIIDEPNRIDPLDEPLCGSAAEYTGFQDWNDRKAFLYDIELPSGERNVGTSLVNLGDLDADGCEDIATFNYSQQGAQIGIYPAPPIQLHTFYHENYILMGKGEGDLGDNSFRTYDIEGHSQGCGDLNGDGRSDVLSHIHKPMVRDNFEVRFGTPSGLPVDADLTLDLQGSLPTGTDWRSPLRAYPIGDVNGDGYDDILVILGVDDHIDWLAFLVFRGSSTGVEEVAGLVTNTSLGYRNYMMWNWTGPMAHTDINGDGYSDVIFTHYTEQTIDQIKHLSYITVHFGSAQGFSPEPSQTLNFQNPTSIHKWLLPIDANGDRYGDIAFVGYTEGIEYVLSILGGSAEGLVGEPLSTLDLFQNPFHPLPESMYFQVALSDIDSDNMQDLFIVKKTSRKTMNASWYENELLYHPNLGGRFADEPTWTYGLPDSQSPLLSIVSLDYDGDGRGDLAVSVPPEIIEDPSGGHRTVQGRLLVLLCAHMTDLEHNLFLKKGPKLYSQLMSYDFLVEVVSEGSALPRRIEMHLDPGGASARIGWNRDGTGFSWVLHGTGDELMPIDRITSDPSPFTDQLDGRIWINYSIVFDWSWPHEESCDIHITCEYDDHVANETVTHDVFSVENDLDLIGDMTVEGKHQGVLEWGDWVRGGEVVTISGLWVVYQGTTDVFPPPSCCEVIVLNNPKDYSKAPNTQGEEVGLSLRMINRTDPYEQLSIRLQGLPPGSKGPTSRTFRLKVDADPPELRDPIPDGDEWISADPVLVGITADDTGTSGVDASTLEFSFRGSLDNAGWTRSGVASGPDGPVVDGMASLSLPDGDDYFLRWRVRDLVGNLHVMPSEVRLRIDTRNVTFTDAFPEDSDWHNISQLLAGVTITDVEGSGIDVDSIEYRVSHHNLSSYGAWFGYEGQHTDSQVIDARVYVHMGEGPFNYIQWRAADIAGNGVTASGHFRIQVDTLPVTFSHFQPTGIQTETDMNVSVLVDDGQWGVGIDFDRVQLRVRTGDRPFGDWRGADIVHIATNEPPFGRDGIEHSEVRCYATSLLSGLVEGIENYVQFRAWDRLGNGPALSDEYRIRLDTEGPYFFKITPEPEEVLPHPEVAVSVCIDDALSGVDIHTVMYRFGREGEGSLGEWARMPVMPVDGHCEGMVTILLDRGRTNYVQFRARDTLGNMNVSRPRAIWVNNLPVAVIASPIDGSTFTEGTRVTLSAEGSSDPDGDPIELRWMLTSPGEQTTFVGGRTTPLKPGAYNLTLVVTDVHDAQATASVHITVEEADMWLYGGFTAILLVLLLASVTTLVALYVRIRRDGDVLE